MRIEDTGNRPFFDADGKIDIVRFYRQSLRSHQDPLDSEPASMCYRYMESNIKN